MTSPSFTADPAAIEALARLVDGRVADLRSATARFRGPALGVDDAFGFLGPSDDLVRDYLAVAQQCVRTLDRMATTLEGAATGLHRTAAGYRAAEHASTVGP